MAADTLRISEIFLSIQGESTRTGCPCVFVRLAGCHLRCRYCDTEYALAGGETRSIDDVFDVVMEFPCELVQITGGEPLLQPRVHELIARLCDTDRTVVIETSGACDIRPCDPRAIRILDLKTPGSGEVERNLASNVEHLTAQDEVKFVIADRADYDWARAYVHEHALAERCGAVLFSPVFQQPPGTEIPGLPGLAPRELAGWILEDGLPVRLQLQIHKYIWDPHARGV